jgi:hypothetical protein
LADIQIENVQSSGVPPEEVVVYKREPTPDEMVGLAEAFDLLNPRLRYRGKFAYKFLVGWLNKLADEYKDRSRGVFGDCEQSGGVRRQEFVLSNFASKSCIPTGLDDFIRSVRPNGG